MRSQLELCCQLLQCKDLGLVWLDQEAGVQRRLYPPFPAAGPANTLLGPCSSDSRESSKADLTVKAGHTRGPSRISLPTTGMPLCYLDTQLSVSIFPLP